MAAVHSDGGQPVGPAQGRPRLSPGRVRRIVVTGELPGSGRKVTITTDAFEARALQHEIDHCNGLLFLDKVSGAHAIYQRKVYL